MICAMIGVAVTTVREYQGTSVVSRVFRLDFSTMGHMETVIRDKAT